MAMKRTLKPRRQEDIFRVLMVALVLGIVEDIQNDTDNHAVLFEATVSACLDSGIPPEHPVAVMNQLLKLAETVNIHIGQISNRGECPN